VNFVDDSIGTNTSTSFTARTNDLSAVAAVNNNPNFKFRIVTEFESTATDAGLSNYVPTSSASYATSGTIRIDYLVVSGVPTSGSPQVLLTIGTSGGDAVLTWTDAAYTLLAAPTVDGLYTNVVGATSPHNTPMTAPQMYFRLTNSAAGP
jgi:hypothetical protein